MKATITAIMSLVCLTACVSHPERLYKTHSKSKTTEIFSSTAGIRNVILAHPSDSIYCAEPPPDASLNTNRNSGFGLSIFSGGNESDSHDDDNTEGALGGRSVNVLLTREIMYRLCELYMNTDFSDEQKMDLFKSTLDTVVQLNQTNLGVGTDGSTNVTISNTEQTTDSAKTELNDTVNESIGLGTQQQGNDDE